MECVSSLAPGARPTRLVSQRPYRTRVVSPYLSPPHSDLGSSLCPLVKEEGETINGAASAIAGDLGYFWQENDVRCYSATGSVSSTDLHQNLASSGLQLDLGRGFNPIPTELLTRRAVEEIVQPLPPTTISPQELHRASTSGSPDRFSKHSSTSSVPPSEACSYSGSDVLSTQEMLSREPTAAASASSGEGTYSYTSHYALYEPCHLAFSPEFGGVDMASRSSGPTVDPIRESQPESHCVEIKREEAATPTMHLQSLSPSEMDSKESITLTDSTSSTQVHSLSPQQHQQAQNQRYQGNESSLPTIKIDPDPLSQNQHCPPTTAKYHCPICLKPSTRTFNYRNHLETHNPRRARPFVCLKPGCGKCFYRPHDLKRHDQSVRITLLVSRRVSADSLDMQVHLKSKDFICFECGHGFPRKDSLQRYVASF